MATNELTTCSCCWCPQWKRRSHSVVPPVWPRSASTVKHSASCHLSLIPELKCIQFPQHSSLFVRGHHLNRLSSIFFCLSLLLHIVSFSCTQQHNGWQVGTGMCPWKTPSEIITAIISTYFCVKFPDSILWILPDFPHRILLNQSVLNGGGQLLQKARRCFSLLRPYRFFGFL